MKRLTWLLLWSCAGSRPPAAVDDVFSTPEDTPLLIATAQLVANDVNVSFVSASPMTAQGGRVDTLSAGQLRYVPAANFSGTDTFTYVAGGLTGTVTVTVIAVDDAPVVGTDNVELVRTDLSHPQSVTVAVLANDADPDGPIALAGASGLTINPDQTVTYTAPGCFTGRVALTYTLSNGAVGAVNINVHVPGTDTDADGFIDSEEATAGTNPNDPLSVPRVLCGRLTYERVMPKPGLPKLDYHHIVPLPIRGARVEVVSGEALGASTSDARGIYRVTWLGTPMVRVRIWAQTLAPPITVQDNTRNGAAYVMESPTVDATTTSEFALNATSGVSNPDCTSGCYTGPRVSAPFACLDTLYTVSEKFLGLANPPAFPLLKVNWSVDNRIGDGQCGKQDGCIGTSHYSRLDQSLYILGDADNDADEFDDHVMAHEWGHYFEARLSRSDSLGGAHSYGDILDPRLAWSEGFGNAMSAIGLYPDDVYRDANGAAGQGAGLYIPVDSNSSFGLTTPDPFPGWYSETTVQALLYDLFDPGNDEPFDEVALGLQPLYDAMVGAQRTTQALTTVFSFVSALKQANPGASGAINGLVTHHTLNATYGIATVQDELGSGETHGAGVPGALPVYQPLTQGFFSNALVQGPVTADEGYSRLNKLRANRFGTWVAADDAADHVGAVLPSGLDIDLDVRVYDAGDVIGVGESSGLAGDITGEWATRAGRRYVLVCQSWDEVVNRQAICQMGYE